jgi:hypothetical protein
MADPAAPGTGSDEPLSVLERFVDEFGLPMTLPGRPPRRFIVYDSLPFGGATLDPTALLAIENPEKSSVLGTTMIRVSSLGVLEIAVAFYIDIRRYKQFLRLR